MRETINATVEILNESSPYLLLGFLLAGIIHVALERFPRITAQFVGRSRRSIVMAALIGAPLPLCSCSVVPAALALRRRGASKATTASFLVSVPETDVVSILVTLALIGPAMAFYRPAAGIACALAIGMAVRWFENRERPGAQPAPGGTANLHDCCAEGTAEALHADHEQSPAAPAWRRAFRYGFVEMFDDIVPSLFIGIILAGIIGVWLPEINPSSLAGGSVLSYLLAVAVGIPLYVCAAASTPIAAGLIAGGVSPGAAMAFLLAGPATNLASIVVLRGDFGNRILAVYLAGIAVASIAAGLVFDLLFDIKVLPGFAHAHEHGASDFQVACTIVFIVWMLLSAWRSRLLPRTWQSLSRTAARLSPP